MSILSAPKYGTLDYKIDVFIKDHCVLVSVGAMTVIVLSSILDITVISPCLAVVGGYAFFRALMYAAR